MTKEEKEELAFCQNTVLTASGKFIKYGWDEIISRCETLNNSGSERSENRYYLHKDHLGSVVGISDGSGNILSEYEYDVFGNFTLSGSDIGNSILFTGREFDKEIGLYYFRARYYSASLGRFISRDPIGQNDDVNLYAYVGNNSVMFVDPSGEIAKEMVGDVGYKMFISIFIFGVESCGDEDNTQFYADRTKGNIYNLALGGVPLLRSGLSKVGTKIAENYADDTAKVLDDYADDAAKILEDTKIKYPYTQGVVNMAGGNFVNNALSNLKMLSGKSADDIAKMLEKEGYEVSVNLSTKSSVKTTKIIKINNPGNGKNITQVQVSPGGGRHGELPYVKISTSDSGIIKIVDGPKSLYKSNGPEKAEIFFTQ